MGWQLRDRPKIVKVTKKLAQTFAEMDAAPRDRPLSERRLMVYRKILQEGGFRPVNWASVECKETGGTYRVNGKHTSTMLANLPETPEFYAILEEYTCDTLEDVAKLYATFDSSIQSRNARDIYLSFAATVPELKGLPASHITVAVTGMSMHLQGGNESSKGRDQAADRAENLLEYPEFVLWLSGIFSSGESGGDQSKRGERQQSKHLRRQPVAGAMMGCWLKAKGPANLFWEAVRDETGATPNLPDRKLARFLLTTAVNDGSGAKKFRPVSGREMYVRCIHGWNAWRKNESTNLNYYPDKDVPSFK